MEDNFSEFTICTSCSESITHVKWSNPHLSNFFSIILWYFIKNSYSQPNSLTDNSICYHIPQQQKIGSGKTRQVLGYKMPATGCCVVRAGLTCLNSRWDKRRW